MMNRVSPLLNAVIRFEFGFRLDLEARRQRSWRNFWRHAVV